MASLSLTIGYSSATRRKLREISLTSWPSIRVVNGTATCGYHFKGDISGLSLSTDQRRTVFSGQGGRGGAG